MRSIIEEIQSDCLDYTIPTSQILQKARLTAQKLKITEIQEWLERELHGYKKGDIAPTYRLIRGSVKVLNPYRGLLPLVFENTQQEEYYATCFVGQPISELEDATQRDPAGVLEFPFSSEVQRELMSSMEIPLQPVRRIDPAQLKGIIYKVRVRVQDWAVKLEQEGIRGEGLSFSPHEQRAASAVTNNFFASVNNSNIQQAGTNAVQTMTIAPPEEAIRSLTKLIEKHLDSAALDSKERREVEDLLAKVRLDLGAPASESSLRSAFTSIRTIFENVAGSVIASGIAYEIGKVFK